uniref:peptidyl-tRNA hydrolase n=1 Tax=Caligus clemensi TaxID=344056 RepID=C1C127_CALCM|nr:Peptidyl-tRNA hydrolase 2, mitochondrial precursor [Caligus clemensi]
MTIKHEEEGPESEGDFLDWWTKQFLIMFAGIACGLVANSFLIRTRSTLSGPSSSMSFMNFLCQQTKMVFLVRSDLGLGKGKVASQVAHAAILCYQSAQRSNSKYLTPWESTGQMKVVLKVLDEEEMNRLAMEAEQSGLTTGLVRDAGRTQIPSGTKTVIGIGPNSLEEIDRITGHLKLY